MVVDLWVLIKWIKINKNGFLILIGISLGGFIINLIFFVEEEIDVLVFIFYVNWFFYFIWNIILGKFIREDLEYYGVMYDDLIDYWKIIELS